MTSTYRKFSATRRTACSDSARARPPSAAMRRLSAGARRAARVLPPLLPRARAMSDGFMRLLCLAASIFATGGGSPRSRNGKWSTLRRGNRAVAVPGPGRRTAYGLLPSASWIDSRNYVADQRFKVISTANIPEGEHIFSSRLAAPREIHCLAASEMIDRKIVLDMVRSH